MGRIDDLRKSLLSMSSDEKLALIRGIRADRKIQRNPVKEKKATKKKAGNLASIKAALGKMSPEDLKLLMGE